MAAASPATISVEHYLASSYELDRDFVDGVLEKRNLGSLHHSILQRHLLLLVCGLSAAVRERTFPQTRVQVAPTRFRVPDLCMMPHCWSGKRIITTPPMLCLEILHLKTG